MANGRAEDGRGKDGRDEVCAREVMSTDVVTFDPETRVSQAKDILLTRGVRGAPVVDRDGRLIGVVSMTDINRVLGGLDAGAVLEEWYRHGGVDRQDLPAGSESVIDSAVLQSKTVREIMSERLFTVTTEDGASLIASTMRKYHIHRVIVIDREKVVGVVTSFDLLKLLEKH